MATTMQVGDIIAITYTGRLFGQTTMTVLHYELTSVGSLTAHPTWAVAVIGLLNTVATGLATFYNEACSEDLISGAWWVQKVYPTRMAKVDGVASPDEGLVLEGALPPGVSASLTKRGAVASRHAIGGVRMPALALSWAEAGYLSAAAITKYTDLCIQMAAPISSGATGNLQPVIFNALAPNLSIDVASMIPQETVRTNKRRVVGRGI